MNELDIVLKIIVSFFEWLAILWGAFCIISVLLLGSNEEFKRDYTGFAIASIIVCAAIVIAIEIHT